jgi:hypothetical protein
VSSTADGPGCGSIHFYVDDATAAASVGWEPDRDPRLFASGVGHNLLELHSRLRDRDLPLTLGEEIPEDARLVLYYQQYWDRVTELRAALRAAPYRTLLVRSDAPLWWDFLLPADHVVVPNTSDIWRRFYGRRARHIPGFPQRGLRPRAPHRRSVATVFFKGNPESVPDYLREKEFRDALRDRGLRLVLDVPPTTSGSEQRWHDFSDVDVALCVRAPTRDGLLLNKPATRLVNAWCAGVIPLVSPEPAYLELLNDGVDGLVVRSADDVLAVLDRLARDGSLAARMFQASRERGAAFTAEEILEQWHELLLEVSGPPLSRRSAQLRRTIVLHRFVLRAGRALIRRGRGRFSGRGSARGAGASGNAASARSRSGPARVAGP